MKKKITTWMAAAAMMAASTFAPAQKAEAGILLAPAGVGIVLIVLGFVYDSVGLIILDADGNVAQQQLESKLAGKYTFIESPEVIRELAQTVRAKVSTEAVKNGEKVEVRLSREEVLNILEPTGLVELAPEQVEALIQDLS